MRNVVVRYRLAWLGVGLLAGLCLGGYWPHVPLHAVGSDHADTICVATGYVELDAEGIFYLDSMTGMLIGAVPSRRPATPFQCMWQTNVNADLASALAAGKRPGVQLPKTPRYLLTTGTLEIPSRGAREAFGRSLIYVTETQTGIVLVYALPGAASARNNSPPFRGKFVPWAVDQFATAPIRADE